MAAVLVGTTINKQCAALTVVILAIIFACLPLARSEQQEIYGTQCSFAITGSKLDGCNSQMLDKRQEFYDYYMKGCYQHYTKRDCDWEEFIRHRNNEEQPQSMVNMTSTGYYKMKAPEKLFRLLSDFWESNKHRKELEDWGDASVFVNHWEAPSYMVSVEDSRLKGAGQHLKDAIWNAAIDGIAEWTGGVAKLRPVSLYGIREYTEGAVLSPHVDRIPLVSSGIVNIAQDVDEPWPLEVYDRNGHAQNITMEPGEMILYESHSLIHGRPFPLKGRFYANVFIHFEPFDGWDASRSDSKLGDNNGDLPPYVLPGSPAETFYRDEHPNGWSKIWAEDEEPPVGHWAADGELDLLKDAAKEEIRILSFADENGWAPIHEAARGGHLEVVKFLVENGVDINVVNSSGQSPLRLAMNDNGPDHEVVKFLKDLGAELKGDAEDNFEASLSNDNVADKEHLVDEEHEEEDDDESDEDELHEAARKGKLKVVKHLIETGADINELNHLGQSPLRLAINYLGPDHEVSLYLQGLGAILKGREELLYKEEKHEDEEDFEEDYEEDDDYFQHDPVEETVGDPTDKPALRKPKLEEPTIAMVEEEILDAIVADDDEEL